MKRIELVTLIIILALGVSSCARKKIRRSKGPKGATSSSRTSGVRPEWITGAMDFCPASELCAVGEGAGQMVAEANARKALSKIFETRVVGHLKAQTTSTQKTDSSGGFSGSTEEDVSNQVEEISDEVLKGVLIKKVYEDRGEGSYYALAALKKRGAADRLRNEMKSLDEKIVGLYKEGRRSSLNKTFRHLEVRENLNKRYEIVADRRYKRKVSYADVQRKKRAYAKLGTVVYVNMEAVQHSKELKNLIVSLLLENDYKVVTDRSKKFRFEVRGSLSHENLHVNVRGFEKYKFLLKLRSRNPSGMKLGGLDYSEAQMGRQLSQAYEKALPAIKKFMVENLGLLNMD